MREVADRAVGVEAGDDELAGFAGVAQLDPIGGDDEGVGAAERGGPPRPPAPAPRAAASAARIAASRPAGRVAPADSGEISSIIVIDSGRDGGCRVGQINARIGSPWTSLCGRFRLS